MKHPWLIAFIFLMAASRLAAAQELDWAQNRLTVLGEGEALAKPDTATILLGVTRDGDTPGAAMQANAHALRTVIETIKMEGIDGGDLQTAGLALQPRYNLVQQRAGDDHPRVVGYTVSNQVTVRVRDLSKVGHVLDKAVSAGANEIIRLNFAVSDRDHLFSSARVRAVENAKIKGSQYAQAAGVRLGSIVRLTEEEGRNPPSRLPGEPSRAAADPGSVPIEGGEIVLKVHVRLTWSITADK